MFRKIQSFHLCCFLIFSAQVLAQSFPQQETSAFCNPDGDDLSSVDVAYGNSTRNCRINTTVDIDRFDFYGNIGDSIKIIVNSVSFRGFVPRVELRDSMGIVAEETCEFSGCVTVIDVELRGSEVHSISVSDRNLSAVGDYFLQLEIIPPDPSPPSVRDGQNVTDRIDPVTDMDFVQFQGKSGTQIRIGIDSTSFRGFIPQLVLWDPDMTRLVDENCDFSGCSFSKDISLMKAGTYLVAISDKDFERTGNYELNVQCLFGDCILELDPSIIFNNGFE